MTERDFETHPYSEAEERLAKWLMDKAGVGGGDDPVGFFLASYEYVVTQRNRYRAGLERIIEGVAPKEFEDIAREALDGN